MDLKGEIHSFSLMELMNIVNLAQKTGTLRIYGEQAVHAPAFLGNIHDYSQEEYGQQAEVYFQEGQVLKAAINTVGDQLILMLGQNGKLSDQQVALFLAHYRGVEEKGVALHLINAEIVAKEDIVGSIQKHTMDVIYTVLDWEEREFEFVELLPDFH